MANRIGSRASTLNGVADNRKSSLNTFFVDVDSDPTQTQQQDALTGLRTEYNLFVRVGEAKDLPKNVGDIHVVIAGLANGQTIRTKTIFRDSTVPWSPFWGDEYNFVLQDELRELSLLAFTEGKKGKGPLECIGKVALPNDQLRQLAHGNEEWYPLMDSGRSLLVCGDVHISLSVTPATGLVPGKIEFEIIECSGLAARSGENLSSPCVEVTFNDATFTTEVQPKTIAPRYNEKAEFTLAAEADVSTASARTSYSKAAARKTIVRSFKLPKLEIRVWNQKVKAKRMKNDFLGEVLVNIAMIEPYVAHDMWLSLQHQADGPKTDQRESVFEAKLMAALQPANSDANPAFNALNELNSSFTIPAIVDGGAAAPPTTPGPAPAAPMTSPVTPMSPTVNNIVPSSSAGSLRLKIQYSTEHVLPIDQYQEFLQLIDTPHLELIRLLARVTPMKEPLARCCVRLCEATNLCGGVVHFLKRVVTQEVTETLDVNIIFRGNTLGSKAIDMYMKMAGLPYLRGVLRPLVQRICISQLDYEVDPTRLSEGANLETNWANLKGLVKQVAETIFSSGAAAPAKFRHVFSHIRAKCAERWPDDQVVRYTAISGFLFLRFFCPAILNPKLFDMMDDHPDPAGTGRVLTLIAKTIQNLSNLAEFGAKEPFMSPMNEFISANMERMKTFLDEFSADEDVVPHQEKGKKGKDSKRPSSGRRTAVDMGDSAAIPLVDGEREAATLYRYFRNATTLMDTELKANADLGWRPQLDQLPPILDLLAFRLQDAIDARTRNKIKAIVQTVEANPDREDNVLIVATIQKMIKDYPKKSLATHDRIFLREGTMTKISKGKKQTRHFFLFNDLLIYAQGKCPVHTYRSDAALGSAHAQMHIHDDSADGIFAYKGEIPMKKLVIADINIMQERPAKFGEFPLDIINLAKKKVITILFSTLQRRQQWMNEMGKFAHGAKGDELTTSEMKTIKKFYKSRGTFCAYVTSATAPPVELDAKPKTMVGFGNTPPTLNSKRQSTMSGAEPPLRSSTAPVVLTTSKGLAPSGSQSSVSTSEEASPPTRAAEAPPATPTASAAPASPNRAVTMRPAPSREGSAAAPSAAAAPTADDKAAAAGRATSPRDSLAPPMEPLAPASPRKEGGTGPGGVPVTSGGVSPDRPRSPVSEEASSSDDSSDESSELDE